MKLWRLRCRDDMGQCHGFQWFSSAETAEASQVFAQARGYCTIIESFVFESDSEVDVLRLLRKVAEHPDNG